MPNLMRNSCSPLGTARDSCQSIKTILIGIAIESHRPLLNNIRQTRRKPISFPTVDGRNPASPWMVETPKNNGITHPSTGAGFRNHPP